jgi:hypothetical protein
LLLNESEPAAQLCIDLARDQNNSADHDLNASMISSTVYNRIGNQLCSHGKQFAKYIDKLGDVFPVSNLFIQLMVTDWRGETLHA